MRSMLLALGCIAAVGIGWLCGRLHAELGLPLALVILGALVLGLWFSAAQSRRAAVLLGGLIICTGLLRGASVRAEPPARVPERGWSNQLRSFEVVGASEPGPRCRLELRGPGAVNTIIVAAPPEVCPSSSGDQVTLLASALQPTWRTQLDGEDHVREPVRDLGRGHVIWQRPTLERGPLRRSIDAYWRWVASQRQRAWSSTRGDAASSLVVAAGLGLRSALPPELRDQLRSAGLGHLIAVSGLHIAVAALWLQVLARRAAVLLGVSPSYACVLAWLPLWGYVGLTGGAASAVRAAAMLTAVELGAVVGRPVHPPTTLVCVAAMMLVWQPSWLLDPGFALSLAAMTAIVSAPRELGVLAMSWRITWATAPLSVVYFEVAPLHGLLGNAVALPLFGLMMPAALVASVVPGLVGAGALELARLFAIPILDVCVLLARVPAAGPGGLLCAGLLGLGLRRVSVVRSDPATGATGNWLPPRLACVLAVVISTGLLVEDARARRAVGPPSFDWIAMGSVRSTSLLVVDPAHEASACLYRSTDSSATWRRLFELLQVRRISRLDARLPPDPPDPDTPTSSDPGTRALANQLERAGIELGPLDAPEDRCRPPARAQVRAALHACRARQGGRGRALARGFAGQVSCRIEDRWVLAAEL